MKNRSKTPDEHSVRIVQLSDPHLDLGQERARRLSRVIVAATAAVKPDLLLITGDLTEHGTAAEYRQFFSLLPAEIPYLVIPGNHDDPATLADVHPDGQPSAVAQRAGHVTVVGVDSSVVGTASGALAHATLAQAESHLSSVHEPVVLALHHPPVRIGQPGIDALRLENPDDLHALITRHPNIIATVCGHAHLAFASTFADRPLIGAPGVASTLRIDTDDLVTDVTAPPGYVIHTITDEIFTSTMHVARMEGHP